MKLLFDHLSLSGLKNKFTDDEKNYLVILYSDDFFNFSLKQSRLASNIPKDGLNLDIPIDAYHKSGTFAKINFDKVIEEAQRLISSYNLPEYWLTTFASIIVFNFALVPEKANYKPIRVTLHNRKLVIEVNEKFNSVTSFIKQLQKDPILKQALAELPMTPHIPGKEFEIKRRISELGQIGKKDKAILDELMRENQNSLPFAPDYTNINKYRHRMEGYIGRIMPKRLKESLSKALQARLLAEIAPVNKQH